MGIFRDNIYAGRDVRSRYLLLLILFAITFVGRYLFTVYYSPDIITVDQDLINSIQYVKPPAKQFDKTKDNTKYTTNKWPEKTRKSKKNTKSKRGNTPIKTFHFNPNTTSRDSLTALGLSRFTVNSLLKYRSKGGKVKSIEHFAAWNGLEDSTFQRLKPYLDLPKKSAPISKPPKAYTKRDSSQKTYKKYPKKIPQIIEINTADTTDFKNLYGIGKVYASRIIKYRNSVVGFHSIHQIKNVYGITDSLFQTIKSYLTVDLEAIDKIDFNSLDKAALGRYRMIGYKKAKYITAYKKMHGNFQSMDDLTKIHALQPPLVDSLKLYFDVR